MIKTLIINSHLCENQMNENHIQKKELMLRPEWSKTPYIGQVFKVLSTLGY
jgi:hypothetical protein